LLPRKNIWLLVPHISLTKTLRFLLKITQTLNTLLMFQLVLHHKLSMLFPTLAHQTCGSIQPNATQFLALLIQPTTHQNLQPSLLMVNPSLLSMDQVASKVQFHTISQLSVVLALKWDSVRSRVSQVQLSTFLKWMVFSVLVMIQFQLTTSQLG